MLQKKIKKWWKVKLRCLNQYNKVRDKEKCIPKLNIKIDIVLSRKPNQKDKNFCLNYIKALFVQWSNTNYKIRTSHEKINPKSNHIYAITKTEVNLETNLLIIDRLSKS